MDEAKQKILIIEDDSDVADMLNAYFRVQGYEVFTVNWGEDGVRTCQDSPPDLVILDIRLPDIDGYEVAQRLRSNHRTSNIPIVFLTEKRDRDERLRGLELGADDYITKPFDIQELRLRVRNAMRRSAQDFHNNPVTDLPDGTLVDEQLTDCLGWIDWEMVVISLENLDEFREVYGFVASDDVLRAVALLINNVANEVGSQEIFLGHLGLTDFVLITRTEHAAIILERIRSRLEQSLDYFYPIKDRGKSAGNGMNLFVKLGKLRAVDETFTTLDGLKLALLRTKK